MYLDILLIILYTSTINRSLLGHWSKSSEKTNLARARSPKTLRALLSAQTLIKPSNNKTSA